MAERFRHWGTISEAQIQFPALAIVTGNQAVKYSLPCLMLPKMAANFNFFNFFIVNAVQ